MNINEIQNSEFYIEAAKNIFENYDAM